MSGMGNGVGFWREFWLWNKKRKAYWAARAMAAIQREGDSDITAGMPAEPRSPDSVLKPSRISRFWDPLFPFYTHCVVCREGLPKKSRKGICGQCDAW